MNSVYLSLGTNMGDREKNLKDAVNIIKRFDSTKIIKVSKIYETEPWGYTDQGNFLNLCLEIKTSLSPYELLEKCQDAEQYLKRERLIRWGPRTIDIDILLYNDIICEDEKLILPHPRIQERAFVLIPLMDLNEELIIKGQDLKDWLKVVDLKEVKEYTGNE